ncbi:ADAMTS-like protein 5 [Antedon mediterranea]|uniref:ADAMTS-like protein 5 n=1 Tax=Antedon mediterranea TaxID=105859 RepID=UPI003AF59DF6
MDILRIYASLLLLGFGTCKKHFNNKPYLDTHSVWSEWSYFSTCSRSCGGGASFRTRHCASRIPTLNSGIQLCDGESKEFKACNTQPCPPSGPDFRDMQCSVYNNKKMFGHLVREWEPITSQPNTCELTCLAKGTHFFYTFGKVLDGTRCNKESMDMCIYGQCIPVGCDGELNSDAKKDVCMKCGGKNDTCSQYKLVYVEPPPTEGYIGYRNCTVIPAGATHIEITENTQNFLAMVEGSQYVLNGDWSLHWSGNINVGGTVFEYVRKTNGNERLYAKGPVKRLLTLQVILTDSNGGPNTSISYWLPKKDDRFSNEVPKHKITKTLTKVKHESPTKNSETKHGPFSDKNYFTNDKPITTHTYKAKFDSDRCPACEKIRGGRVKHFCSSDFVIHAEVVDKHIVNGQIRFDVALLHTYKTSSPLKERVFLWIQSTCNCPIIRTNKDYLIMGVNTYDAASGESRLVILKNSLVRSWKTKDHEKWVKTQDKQETLCKRFL